MLTSPLIGNKVLCTTSRSVFATYLHKGGLSKLLSITLRQKAAAGIFFYKFVQISGLVPEHMCSLKISRKYFLDLRSKFAKMSNFRMKSPNLRE